MTVKKSNHFLGAENHGQRLRLFRSGDDVLEGPVLLESHFVEEAKCGNGDEDRTGSQLPFFRQLELISTNLLRPQPLG
jgi:hypothetical protein